MRPRKASPAAKGKVRTSLTTAETAPAIVDKSRHLKVTREPGKTEDRQYADLVSQGLATSASTAIRFAKFDHGEVSLTDMVTSLRDCGDAVNRGDLSASEQMLNAQAVALNSIFAELARRAALNMGEYPEAFERYMRLSLKAQTQCRATVETIAAMKNPPVIFARQANFSNGPQQVNNRELTHPGSRARETQLGQSKLLETSDVERLDTGTQSAAGEAHQDVETVGALNRPDDRGR